MKDKPESGSELRSPQRSSWMELGSILRPGRDLCWDSSTICDTICRISLINMMVCREEWKRKIWLKWSIKKTALVLGKDIDHWFIFILWAMKYKTFLKATHQTSPKLVG